MAVSLPRPFSERQICIFTSSLQERHATEKRSIETARVIHIAVLWICSGHYFCSGQVIV